MILACLLAFAVSGAAGLVYESVWSRYLGLFLGHSSFSQTLVIAIFLGGMSWGALIAARRTERLRQPLFAYAIVEAVVGLMGLGFHAVYAGVTGFAYEEILPRLAAPAAVIAAKWAIAALLILPQSILLGATFPLMSAGLLRRMNGHPGRVLAHAYFANSIGAAGGVLLSGFVLIAAAGLPGTVTAAAILNLLVAMAVLVALRIEQGPPGTAPTHCAAAPTPPGGDSLSPVLIRILLIASFGTAIASFAYEIAWIRMLSLVLGSAAHSFELMLSAFVLGLALGSFWIRSRADTMRDPVRALGVVQWVMGILAIGTLPVYLASFGWTAQLLTVFSQTDGGYQAFNLARYAICLAVMLPATFCAGITLPLITRALLAGGAGERAIGVVYSVNTLGSIVGVAGAGLILLPWLGVKGLLLTGAGLDIALGIALLAVRSKPAASPAREAVASGGRALRALTRPLSPAATALAAAAVAAVVIASIATSARFDRALLSSGVYRTGLASSPEGSEIDFYRDGRTATVAVRSNPMVGRTLLTNGKPDASISTAWLANPTSRRTLSNDESTQVLLALVTLAHAPAARDAAVIGQGSGITSHALLGSPVLERLVTIEIEPEMIQASRAFHPLNRRVFEDSRASFAVDDAKSYFASSGRRFDLILSEPSNPWVSGVSGLFTTEFYRALRGHLTADGVFGQWLHLYEINDDLVLRILTALHENFTDYEVFLVAEGDMLVVATNRKGGLSPDWSVTAFPGIAEDLRGLPPLTPREFEAMRVANQHALAPVIAFGPPANSDYFPVLDLGAERARHLGESATGFIHLSADRHSVTRAMLRRRIVPDGAFEVPMPGIPSLRSLVLSAQLRAAEHGAPPPSLLRDPRGRAALHGLRTLDASMAGGAPPVDWKLWIASFMQVERDLHGTAAGVVDESFYGRVARYLERAKAPEEAKAVVAFARGLGAWDYASAARSADVLAAAALRGDPWIHADVLLDGAVTAKLWSGDRRGAQRAHKALRPLSGRARSDVRSQLLYAYTIAFDDPVAAPLGALRDP